MCDSEDDSDWEVGPCPSRLEVLLPFRERFAIPNRRSQALESALVCRRRSGSDEELKFWQLYQLWELAGARRGR